jgi:hypothetical protein
MNVVAGGVVAEWGLSARRRGKTSFPRKSGIVGQWNSYVDIRGDSGHWDDIEHVGPGLPTTWNVAGVHPNSQNRDIELDMGLDLALNGHSVYQ